MDLVIQIRRINGPMKWTVQREKLKIEGTERKLKSRGGEEGTNPRDGHHGYPKQRPDYVNYQDKAKRCSHALEVMLKARTSKDVMIDVIRDLIADINN